MAAFGLWRDTALAASAVLALLVKILDSRQGPFPVRSRVNRTPQQGDSAEGSDICPMIFF
jgi:hypothetical protein